MQVCHDEQSVLVIHITGELVCISAYSVAVMHAKLLSPASPMQPQ
jgi:hypothetical protein